MALKIGDSLVVQESVTSAHAPNDRLRLQRILLESRLVVLQSLLRQVAELRRAQSDSAQDLSRQCSHQPVQQSVKSSVSLVTMQDVDQPYSHIRAFIWACKVFLKAYIVFLCFYGKPQLFFQGLYQGLAHGWSTECEDWYRCNK